MLTGDQLDLLREILFLDADAAASHEAALGRVAHPALCARLRSCRDDHLHHLHALNTFLIGQGAAPVKPRLEVRHGPLTRCRGGTVEARTEAALTAVAGCEQLVVQSYALLLREEWPPELEALLRCHYQEERAHGLWLGECLRGRHWEARLQGVLP
jgi:hypothetical protein